MWKPGTEKPKSQSPKTPRQEPKQNGKSEDITPLKSASSLKKSASSSAKKRLTGATMNMRFMKRKKETEEYDERRKSGGLSPMAAPSSKDVADAPEKDDPMDIEEDASFSRATPADMHGMLSSLIGRRSFGGFNAAMEEAWKESKAALEDTQLEKPKNKVSDEELLQRYKNLVEHRSGASRPVGNLKDKGRKKKGR
jgi:hypothetical protein